MNDIIQTKTKRELRLFHTADLHLGSPFSGFDVKTGELRRRRQVDSFARSLEYAKNEGCDAILIAGDLLDCGYVDGDTVKATFDAIERCGIPVILSPGNHDPFSEGGIYSSHSLPSNLYIFDSPEMGRIDLPEIGLCVHGYAFESDRYSFDPLASGVELCPDRFNVMCAHGDIFSAISTYAPINLAQLGELSLDYVALGHIHKYSEPIRIGKTTVAYSGFQEGRSFDECGFGGALVITLSADRTPSATVERVILSDKQYLSELLDVTGAESRSDILNAIKEFIQKRELGKETCLRLTLVGNVHPKAPAALSLSADEVGLALIDIKNETVPLFDAEYLENDITLRGALYRQLLPSLSSPDPEVRRVAVGALRMGLAALEGRMLTS